MRRIFRKSCIRVILGLLVMHLIVVFGGTEPVWAGDENINGKTVILAGAFEEDYDVVIAKEILRRARYTVEFRQCPWARCIFSMREGFADILANVFEKAERKGIYVLWIGTYF